MTVERIENKKQSLMTEYEVLFEKFYIQALNKVSHNGDCLTKDILLSLKPGVYTMSAIRFPPRWIPFMQTIS
jgi:hypothetical protein